MENARRPTEKRSDPAPMPGDLYNQVAAMVDNLRGAMVLTAEAELPIAAGYRRALEIQLADASNSSFARGLAGVAAFRYR